MVEVLSPGDFVVALWVCYGALRKCLQPIKLKGAPDGSAISVCYLPATWRKNISPDSSRYACDVCKEMFWHAEEGWEEAPHAGALREIAVLMPKLAGLAARGDAASIRAALPRLQRIGRDLLLALPPCPLPLSATEACQRCIWAAGGEAGANAPLSYDEATYRARTSLIELAKHMAVADPETFGEWSTTPAEEIVRTLGAAPVKTRGSA